MHAAMFGYTSKIDILMRYGANSEARDQLGDTALHYGLMAKEDMETTIKKLIEYGADAQALNNAGETVLSQAKKHSVAHLAHYQATVTLLENDARSKFHAIKKHLQELKILHPLINLMLQYNFHTVVFTLLKEPIINFCASSSPKRKLDDDQSERSLKKPNSCNASLSSNTGNPMITE